MWLMRAPEGPAKNATGILYELHVHNGYALVGSHYDYFFLKREGWEDRSPEEIKNLYAPPDKLLICRHGGIGDLLVTTPLLREIKKKWPGTQIAYYGVTPNMSILHGNPHISAFISGWAVYEAARHFSTYDDVYDMTHTVEFHTDSMFSNYYSNTLRRFGLPEDNLKPEVYLYEHERREAREQFLKRGIDISRKTTIGVGLTGSNGLKSLPPDLCNELVNLLSKNRGRDIVVFGGTKLDTKVVQKANVHCVGTGLPLRIAAAAIGLLDMFVTVDSGLMHVAGAHKTPQVILQGFLDGHVTCGNFAHSYVFQVEHPCAPCFRHVHQCQRMVAQGLDVAPCMSKHDPVAISDKVDELLKDVSSLGDKAVFNIDFSQDGQKARVCPICEYDPNKVKFNRLARKGRYVYWECPNCGTVSTHKHPDDPFAIYDDVYNLVYEREDRVWRDTRRIGIEGERKCRQHTGLTPPGRVLELGCNNGRVLLGWLEAGWDTYGVDGNARALGIAKEQGHKHLWEGDVEKIVPVGSNVMEEGKVIEKIGDTLYIRTNAFDVVVLSHIMEHLRDPVGLLTKVAYILKPRGAVWMAMPDADVGKAGHFMEWMHINNLSAGEHTVLMTKRALEFAASRACLAVKEVYDQKAIQAFVGIYWKPQVLPLDPTENLVPSSTIPRRVVEEAKAAKLKYLEHISKPLKKAKPKKKPTRRSSKGR